MIAELHPTFPRETTPIGTALDVEFIVRATEAAQQRKAEPVVVCETCKATSGRECRTSSGRKSRWHAGRRSA